MAQRLLPSLAALLALGCAGCGPARSLPPAAVTPAAAPVPAAEPERGPVRLVAVGDLMLGTSVKRLMAAHGPLYPFRKYLRLLGDADLAFGNLETPLSNGGSPTPGKSAASIRSGANFLFRAPPSTARGLAEAGFDVVSLANNHAMDYGAPALRDTLEACRAAGVIPIGAGENQEDAFAPAILERNGQRLALFAISDILPAFSVAGAAAAGVAPARGAEFERRMPAAISRAREEADRVLVSVHWGRERYTGATERQRRLGRRLVDWGADVVIGHHTHCMGPVERYGGGLIHYSLGNFVSYPGSRAPVEAWEVTLRPGESPAWRSLRFRWDGEPLRN